MVFEELSSREQGSHSEQDLLDQVVALEREVRRRDAAILDLKKEVSAMSGNESRYLKQQVIDLKVCVYLCYVR